MEELVKKCKRLGLTKTCSDPSEDGEGLLEVVDTEEVLLFLLNRRWYKPSTWKYKRKP